MPSPSDLYQQIGTVRDSMQSSIVVLHDRGKREVARLENAALIGVGGGGAVGVLVAGILILRRIRRQRPLANVSSAWSRWAGSIVSAPV